MNMNYRNGEECLHASYEDMKDMTLEDAIYILSQKALLNAVTLKMQ